jgi:hypothetical protein
MFLFSRILVFLKDGYKIQMRTWTKDYYIYLKENSLYDSSGNLYYPDFNEYLKNNLHILDNSGHTWEVIDDDLDLHL